MQAYGEEADAKANQAAEFNRNEQATSVRAFTEDERQAAIIKHRKNNG